MTLLISIGVACMAFTAAFTWRAYSGPEGVGGQTRRESIIEAWTNILLGFGINFGMNLLLLPLVGIMPTLAQNFWLGWTYTAVSIVRQYALRRWFNDRIHNFAARAAQRFAPPPLAAEKFKDINCPHPGMCNTCGCDGDCQDD